MAGAFITFEGIEGCGKSSQSRRLAQAVRKAGREVVLTREPGGTPLADALRALFLDPAHAGMPPEAELLLVEAGRADHVTKVILPAISRGAIVICDRFLDSTHAYQGGGRGLSRETIDSVNSVACGSLLPDVTILLDLPAEAGLARMRQRHAAAGAGPPTRIDAEAIDFHRRIRSVFLRRAGDEPHRLWVVDASPSEDEVFESVTTVVRRRLPGILP